MRYVVFALALFAAGQALAVTKISQGAAVTVTSEPQAMKDPSLTRSPGMRTSVMVCAPEGETIYCAGQGVTAATGAPVSDGGCYYAPAVPEDAVWCVAEGSVTGVRVQEAF